ncbi:hypothetical protein Fmac_007003 [Flemingia macrophylla]|uniref:SBg7S n=1 Tax=Flemingia macrophylla TaxID=520843 RepID=A0ABD1NC74_9FABA
MSLLPIQLKHLAGISQLLPKNNPGGPPLQRDEASGLHWFNLYKSSTPAQNSMLPILVDLNGNHLWLNCEQQHLTKLYQAPFCHSTQCIRANTHQCLSCPADRPGCHRNACGLLSTNPITQQTGLGELGQDFLGVYLAQGSQLGPILVIPNFLFSCAPSFLLQKGLPKGTQGVAGFGHGPISLPNQVASHYGLEHQFTMCLGRHSTSQGSVIFGDTAIYMPRIHKQDIFHEVAVTPLTITAQGEYNVRVNSIKVNQHTFSLPTQPEDSGAAGGTMISTAAPHMVLQHSIFEAFTKMFAQQMPKQAQVKPVAPFGLCFNSNMVSKFPNVDLVMDRPNGPVWRISGEELVAHVRPGLTCLAVVNGGMQTRAPVTIGARQLEERVVVFDLARSTLRFSTSTLGSRGLKCGDLVNFVHY